MRLAALSLLVPLLLPLGIAPADAGIPPIWMLMRSLPMPPALQAPNAGSAAVAAGPGQQCRAAIEAAERQAGIPPHLMAAIGRIESGRRTESGSVDPWPWSIDVDGVDHVYDTKAQAVAAVQALQAQGAHSIDVGCMQVNLKYHPEAFASLDQAFDPVQNAAYAARFLVTLHAQTGNWETATAWYHSATPELGSDYQRKVAAVLPEEQSHAPVTAAVATMPPATPPRGPFMLSNHAGAARILPAAVGTVGHSLAFYRSNPIPVASRVALR